VVSGFGFGAAFLGAMATVTQGVAPGERAGLLSAVFTASYLAFCLPAIAAGVAATHVGLARTAEVYGGVVIVLALAAVGGLLRRRTTPAPQSTAPARSPEPVA
jgi:MFS family permease